MKKFIPILKNISLFSELTEAEILSAIEIIKPTIKEYKKGSYVLEYGNTTTEIGLLLSGSLLIIQEDIWGHRSIMNKLLSGNTFAEPFATSKRPLNINIEANEDCTIMFFNLNTILTSSLNNDIHNKIIKNLVSGLANKTLKLNKKLSHMSKRSTRDKLLSYLSSQSQKYKSLEFDIPFNRQQLADYLCVERSAMTVELSKLQKEGILTTNRNHFKINLTDN